MNPVELISRKRDGAKLSPDEIRFLVRGYTDGSIPDYQMAAFLMAYYFQDMVLNRPAYDELAALTLEVADSGTKIDFGDRFGLLYDKHSTGGVGDKLSFICAPIMAACDCPSFLLSGRGLGHTGGTLDKMRSIPGTRVDLNEDEIARALEKTGLVITGQTDGIAPADKKLYALRDVTGTVGSIGLISASILGKKLAVSPTCIVLDIKMGSGAFMKTREDAERLAGTMMGILREAKRPAVALITNMDQPLGRMVGNGLEMRESCRALREPQAEDLRDVVEVSVALAAAGIHLGGKAATAQAAETMARECLTSGRAWEKFKEFMAAQGADVSYLENTDKIPAAGSRIPVVSDRSGYVSSMDCFELGIASNLLGAGRFKKEDEVDPAAGLEFVHKTGDQVKAGEPLLYMHVNDETRLEQARAKIQAAIRVEDARPAAVPHVAGTITA